MPRHKGHAAEETLEFVVGIGRCRLCGVGIDFPSTLVHLLVMVEVNVHEAKTHLSRLLARVARGEEVVIARAGKPVARLVPMTRPKGPRVLGRDKGKLVIAEDFDAPLPPELLATFES